MIVIAIIFSCSIDDGQGIYVLPLRYIICVRRVFVIELWEGPERGCGHRCESRVGDDCAVRPVASLIEDHLDDFEDEATRDAAMRFLRAPSPSTNQPPSSSNIASIGNYR